MTGQDPTGEFGPADGADDALVLGAAAPADATKRRYTRAKKKRPFWIELPLLLGFSLGLTILIKTFLVAAFFIPSGSMQETLALQDRVLVNKLAYRFGDVRHGDIVVFRGPPSWTPEVEAPPPPSNPLLRLLRPLQRALGAAPPGEKDFIKRVIGLPGDTVSCCTEGRVTVNGVSLDESDYLFEDNQQEFGPVKIPDGHLWMMGDHRSVSQDSRAPGQGAVPVDDVIGRAFVVVWPLDHAARLGRPDTKLEAGAAGAAADPLAVGTAAAPPFVAVPFVAVPALAVRRRRRAAAQRPNRSAPA